MSEPEQVDVVVIGLGVGGEEVANQLAKAGLSVVGVEHGLVGGECPYWGCIPTKMMIRAGDALAEAGRVGQLAGRADVSPDWRPVAARLREATDNWDDAAGVDRFTGRGGRFVRGYGVLDGPGRVRVGDDVYRAGTGVVIATGTAPTIPPIEGLAGTPYWTNREAVQVDELPGSLVVLGGGTIGLELAQVFARFGVRVTVVEVADRLLAIEEPETSALAASVLARDGVEIRTGVKVERVSHDADGFILHLVGGEAAVGGERLLVATGRRAQLGDLKLETIGLDPKARFLTIDDRMRAADGVWGVGDLTGHGAFTHVAMYQAGIAIRDILAASGRPAAGVGVSGAGGSTAPPADYRAVPRVTFTDPEIGVVGLTEQQARDLGLHVQVGMSEVPTAARGWIHEAGNDGFIKLVADGDRGVLVGATSVGPMGGEVLGALVVAVHGEVPVEKLRHMIYAYPTFHRAIEHALVEVVPRRRPPRRRAV